jgi:hypothetical protein
MRVPVVGVPRRAGFRWSRSIVHWVYWYREHMGDAAPVLTFEQLAEAVRDAPPPTADDVSITWDGRRLDSREAVLKVLAELEAARSSGRPLGPPLP